MSDDDGAGGANLGSLGDAFVDIRSDFTELKNSFHEAFGDIKKFLGAFEAEGTSALNAIKLGFTALAGVGAVAAIGIGAITASIVALAVHGSEVNDVSEAFQGFAKGAGIDAKDALDKLREGTRGLVDDLTLMQQGTKLLSSGVKLTTTDMSNLGTASVILANRVGGDAKTAFNDLAQALETGASRGLTRVYGLQIELKGATDEMKESILAEGQAMDTASTMAAKRAAIMEAVNKVVQESGNIELDFGEKLDVAKNALRNFGDNLAASVAASPAVNAALDAIEQGLADAFGSKQEDSIRTLTTWVDKFVIVMAGAAEVGVTATKILVESWDLVKVTFDVVVASTFALAEGISKMFEALFSAAEHLPGIGSKFAGIREEFTRNAAAMDSQRKAWMASGDAALDAAIDTEGSFNKIHDSVEKVRQAMIAASAAGVTHDQIIKGLHPTTEGAAKDQDALAKQVAETAKQIKELDADLQRADKQQLSLLEVERLHGGALADLGLKAKELGLTLPASIAKWGEAISHEHVAQALADSMAAVAANVAKGFESAAGVAKEQLSKLGANDKSLVETAENVQMQITAATQVGADAQLAIIDARLSKEIAKLGPLPAEYKQKYDATTEALKAAMAAQLDAIDAKEAAELRKVGDTYFAFAAEKDAETKKVRDAAESQRGTTRQKFDDEIAKVGTLPGIYAVHYNAATGAVQTAAQHQKDIINQTYDTLKERLTASGVLNRQQLDAQLQADKTTYAQMIQYNREYGADVGYTSAQIEAALQRIRQDQALTGEGWKLIGAKLKDAMPEIVSQLGAGIGGGQGLAAVGNAASAMGTIFASTFGKTANEKLGIAVGMAVGQAVGGNGVGEQIGSAIGLAAGAAFGSMFGATALGAALGSAVGGAVGGWIDRIHQGHQIENAIKDIGNEMAFFLSNSMATAIAQTAKNLQEMENDLSAATARHYAELLHLQDIMKNNLTAETLDRWTVQADRLFEVILRGGQVGAAGMQELGLVIGDMLAVATDQTGEWNDSFAALLLKTEKMDGGLQLIEKSWSQIVKSGTDGAGLINDGLEAIVAAGGHSAVIQGYVAGQMAAAQVGLGAAIKVTTDAYAAQAATQEKLKAAMAGIAPGEVATPEQAAAIAALNKELETENRLITTVSVHSQAAGAAMAAGILGGVAAEMAAGKTFVQAIKDQQASITGLGAALDKAGFSGGKMFDALKREAALVADEIAGPALTAIEGYTAAEVGLSNAGQLSNETFAGLANEIGATEKALEDQGKARADVLPAMQNDLQVMWELQQKNHVALDEYTQGLIDEAVQQGLVGESHKSVGDQMLDLTARMTAAVEGLARVFGVVLPADMDTAAAAARSRLHQTELDAQAAAGGIAGAFKDMSFTIPIDFDDGGGYHPQAITWPDGTSPSEPGGSGGASGPGGFAEGGIAEVPTFGVFGEAGPEALVPLERYNELLGGGADGLTAESLVAALQAAGLDRPSVTVAPHFEGALAGEMHSFAQVLMPMLIRVLQDDGTVRNHLASTLGV